MTSLSRHAKLLGLVLLVTASVQASAKAGFSVPVLLGQPSLDQVSVSSALLDVVKQALHGPRHEIASIDYARAASDARAQLADLQPRLSMSLQAAALAPFTDNLDKGIAAGPNVTWSLPTGQGSTEITVGAAARTGHAQAVGAQAAVTTSVPVLSGPDNRRYAAEVKLLAAEAAYIQAQRQIVIDATYAFGELAQAEERMLLATQLRELAEAEYALARDRQERGVISFVELHKLRAGVADAIDDEAAARQDLVESRDRLRDLVGLAEFYPGNTTGLEAQKQLLHVTLPTVPAEPEDWVQVALEQRVDIQAARARVSLAKAELVKAQTLATRVVAFTARATWPHEVTETTVDLRTDLRAGIEATFYLSDPGRTESVAALELSLAKAKRQLHDLEIQVERTVHRALYDIAEIARSLAQAREQLRQDELMLSVSRERLSQGLDLPHAVAAQELVVAQQASRVRNLEARRAALHIALWHAVGLDPVQLRPHRGSNTR